MNKRILELYQQAYDSIYEFQAGMLVLGPVEKKFAELIVSDYARQLVQANMNNPAYAQAMDEYYENKWSHRFD